MKIVKPSYEIKDLSKLSLTKQIETVGRVAYKSENKVKESSDKVFVAKMLEHKHMPVIEFGVLHFELIVPVEIWNDWYSLRNTNDAKYISITEITELLYHDRPSVKLIISGTCRSLIDYINNTILHSLSLFIAGFLYTRKSGEVVFKEFAQWKNTTLVGCRIKELSENKLKAYLDKGLSVKEYCKHKYVLVHFICSRAVSHEIVRHRPCSFLQESQRYCRYNQGKFGNEITVIDPQGAFPEMKDQVFDIWYAQCHLAERAYMDLLANEMSPQAARLVLPNSCKTELFVQATIEEWNHIFAMRVPKSAEPSMRELMIPLHKEMNLIFVGIN